MFSIPDNINEIIELVKQLVNSTNGHVQMLNKRIKEGYEIERERNVEDEDKIKRIREELKK